MQLCGDCGGDFTAATAAATIVPHRAAARSHAHVHVVLILGAHLLRLDLVASLLAHALSRLGRTSGELDATHHHRALAGALRRLRRGGFGRWGLDGLHLQHSKHTVVSACASNSEMCYLSQTVARIVRLNIYQKH